MCSRVKETVPFLGIVGVAPGLGRSNAADMAPARPLSRSSLCPGGPGSAHCEAAVRSSGLVRRRGGAEQVIRQIWISPHFGVLSRYPSAVDKPFPFISPVVLPPHSAVKRLLTIFQLAATRAPALAGVGSEWRLDKT